MKLLKVGHFNWKLVLIKLFGKNEWWGSEGAETSAFVRKLGNWVYVHPDVRVDEERKKIKECRINQ